MANDFKTEALVDREKVQEELHRYEVVSLRQGAILEPSFDSLRQKCAHLNDELRSVQDIRAREERPPSLNLRTSTGAYQELLCAYFI